MFSTELELRVWLDWQLKKWGTGQDRGTKERRGGAVSRPSHPKRSFRRFVTATIVIIKGVGAGLKVLMGVRSVDTDFLGSN